MLPVHLRVWDQTKLIWGAWLIFDLQNQSHPLFVLQIKQNPTLASPESTFLSIDTNP